MRAVQKGPLQLTWRVRVTFMGFSAFCFLPGSLQDFFFFFNSSIYPGCVWGWLSFLEPGKHSLGRHPSLALLSVFRPPHPLIFFPLLPLAVAFDLAHWARHIDDVSFQSAHFILAASDVNFFFFCRVLVPFYSVLISCISLSTSSSGSFISDSSLLSQKLCLLVLY